MIPWYDAETSRQRDSEKTIQVFDALAENTKQNVYNWYHKDNLS